MDRFILMEEVINMFESENTEQTFDEWLTSNNLIKNE